VRARAGPSIIRDGLEVEKQHLRIFGFTTELLIGPYFELAVIRYALRTP
jgi:hypothetical protein